jgi:tetratricopeptide (TPR) repeat protein
MSDPLRNDSAHALDGALEPDRDAKIEQLLLAGLDHYFAAQHEQAINVWTRALFLDRSHARARAYIERARSALAERQRESEELLQNGVAAFNRGDAGEARRLLQAAMTQGAPSDEALAVLDRLNRLEQGSAALRPTIPARDDARWQALAQRRGDESSPLNGVPLLFALSVILVGAAAFLVVTSTPLEWRSLLTLQPSPLSPAVPSGPDAALSVPRRGEMALARARSLAAGGRLRDALTTLDLVRPTDSQKEDADRLRADIQRQIMTLSVTDAPTAERPPAVAPANGPPRQP